MSGTATKHPQCVRRTAKGAADYNNLQSAIHGKFYGVDERNK